MDDIKQKLIKELDKISYLDFKRFEEEPINIEYLRKRKEKIGKQFKAMQIIISVVMMIFVAGIFFLLGSDNFDRHVLKSILNTIMILVIAIIPQLVWNKKYTDAKKNIFIIELIEQIEKNKNNQEGS